MSLSNVKAGITRLSDFIRTNERERIAAAKIREKVIALYQKERDRFGQVGRATSDSKSAAQLPAVLATHGLSKDVQNFTDDLDELMANHNVPQPEIEPKTAELEDPFEKLGSELFLSKNSINSKS